VKVGFTGTRHGMNAAQRGQLRYMLALLRHADQAVGLASEFHYGTHESVQLLADEEAARYAEAHGFALVPHHATRGHELTRNRAIVGRSDILLAAPNGDREQAMGSGTWATVRYMRASHRPVVMLSRGSP
jgi:hypothetical protein